MLQKQTGDWALLWEDLFYTILSAKAWVNLHVCRTWSKPSKSTWGFYGPAAFHQGKLTAPSTVSRYKLFTLHATYVCTKPWWHDTTLYPVLLIFMLHVLSLLVRRTRKIVSWALRLWNCLSAFAFVQEYRRHDCLNRAARVQRAYADSGQMYTLIWAIAGSTSWSKVSGDMASTVLIMKNIHSLLLMQRKMWSLWTLHEDRFFLFCLIC